MKSLSSLSEEYLSPTNFLAKALVSQVMAIDTETNGLDIRDGRGFCVGVSAAIRDNDTYYYSYFPVAHHEGNISDDTKQVLFDVINTRQKVVMHLAKFDLDSLTTAGLEVKSKWYCTLMMAHFLNENVPKGLDWLARNELKNSGKVKKDFSGIWSMGLGHMIPVAEMIQYAGIDSVRCLQLFERLYPYFVKSGFDGSGSQM